MISSTKNGLPSVSSYSALAKAASGDLPGSQPHELGGLGLAEPPDVELRREPVAAKFAERVRERVPAPVGGTVGAEDQKPRRARGPGQVAKQQERRPVGPLEVVEHEQHRRRPRQLGQQPDDRLEQPVALGLRLVLRRRWKVGRAAAQLRDQPRQLGPVLARARTQVRQLGIHGPVTERLEERLVRDHGLARRAPGEHDCAGVVDAPGELRGQRRLADPGVAREQHDPAVPPVRVGSVATARDTAVAVLRATAPGEDPAGVIPPLSSSSISCWRPISWA